MNNGCEFPTSEVMPLNFIDIPPPGAPEFAEMFEPVTLPYNAPSSVGSTVVPTNSFDVTSETAFARFLLFTEEARPVTTTSSNLPTSSCIFKETEAEDSDTWTVCDL